MSSLAPAPEPASFPAMGTDVVVGGATRAELDAVHELFREREQVFSRFLETSELNAVNRSPAPVLLVSALFARAVAVALRTAAVTGGLVDPTLGAALTAFGYDRDLAALEADPRPPGAAQRGRWRELRLRGRLLERPPGVGLDLNGVVKALAVDDALALVAGDGFVSAGGDVAVRGELLVGLPEGGAVQVLHGGVATSGTTRRRWLRGGVVQHHLLDPRTGRPSTSRWRQVTVAALGCRAADTAAKAAFLLDTDGPGWLDARRLPGRFIGDDQIVLNETWRRACS